MLKRTLLTLVASSLTACATAEVSNPCRFIVLKDYDKAFNMKLADEVEAAPASAAWPEIVVDYAGLRDQVRACKGE